MNKEKISSQEIIDQVSVKAKVSKRAAEEFLKVMIATIEDALIAGESVKVKGFGTFKLLWNEARKSVNVKTGEEILLDGFYKVTFIPETSLRDIVNEPFGHLEPVLLDAGNNFVIPEEPVTTEHDPLKLFTEQASEIKDLLSEIKALSGSNVSNQVAVSESTNIIEKKWPAESIPDSDDEDSDDDYDFDEEDLNTIEEEDESFVIINDNSATVDSQNDNISQSNEVEVNNDFESIASPTELAESIQLSNSDTTIEHLPIQDYFDYPAIDIPLNLVEESESDFEAYNVNGEVHSDQTLLQNETGVVTYSSYTAETASDIATTLYDEKDTGSSSLIREETEPLDSTATSNSESEKVIIENDQTQEAVITTEQMEPNEAACSESEISEPTKLSGISDSDLESYSALNSTSEIVNEDNRTDNKDSDSEPTGNTNSGFVFTEEDGRPEIDLDATPFMLEAHSKRIRRIWLWTISMIVVSLITTLGVLYYVNIKVALMIDGMLQRVGITTTYEKQIVIPQKTIIPAQVKPKTLKAAVSDTIRLFDQERNYDEYIASEQIKKESRLDSMARKYYGDPLFWVYIYEANKERIDDPYHLTLGTLIRIPKVDKRLIDSHNTNCISYARKLVEKYSLN